MNHIDKSKCSEPETLCPGIGDLIVFNESWNQFTKYDKIGLIIAMDIKTISISSPQEFCLIVVKILENNNRIIKIELSHVDMIREKFKLLSSTTMRKNDITDEDRIAFLKQVRKNKVLCQIQT